jgi:hypothetical protein
LPDVKSNLSTGLRWSTLRTFNSCIICDVHHFHF